MRPSSLAPCALVAVVSLLACGQTPGATGASAGGAGTSSATTSAGGGGSGPWRSALYPEAWTPAFSDGEGRFLHDFSYAGYHHGEAEAKAPAAAPVLDVVAQYGADPLGKTDATGAAQKALDDAAAMGGAVVFFPEGLYRLDGLLAAHASGVVVRGAGADKTKLYFTASAGMSDGAHLLLSGDATVDLELALTHEGAPRADSVEVADPGDLAPGDDVAIGWVITDAFIEEHGMTGTWKAFNGTWQPFFLRTVVAVDKASSPPRIKLDVPLRYPAKLRDAASVRRQKGAIHECGVESLSISNAVAWDAAWTVLRSHAIRFVHTRDCWIRGVSSFSSPAAPTSGPGVGAHLQSGGILVEESKRVTVADSHLGLAENRGDGGSGYLFEIQRSSEVLLRDDVGENGRHNFIQNWGFGTTGCVFLRVESRGGVAMINKDDTLGLTGLSEFHHSLATANLIDSSTFDDGFSIVNRGDESTGAGLAGTENVLWNLRGKGTLRSLQYRTGYVIGTRDLYPVTDSPLPMGVGTAPIDFLEGLDRGAGLAPTSLYEDQLAKRLAK
ncbi:MAG: glycosyl hydrolase family 28-related protein [Byssovorax sp.]